MSHAKTSSACIDARNAFAHSAWHHQGKQTMPGQCLYWAQDVHSNVRAAPGVCMCVRACLLSRGPIGCGMAWYGRVSVKVHRRPWPIRCSSKHAHKSASGNKQTRRWVAKFGVCPTVGLIPNSTSASSTHLCAGHGTHIHTHTCTHACTMGGKIAGRDDAGLICTARMRWCGHPVARQPLATSSPMQQNAVGVCMCTRIPRLTRDCPPYHHPTPEYSVGA